MFNITKLRKSKTFLFLLFISIISIIYIYYSSKKTQPIAPFSIIPTPTPSSNIRPNQPAFNNIKKFNTNLNIILSVPQSLTVYNAQKSSEDINALAQKIIQYYNLQSDPQNNIVWNSLDKTQFFVVDYKNNYLNFSNSKKDQKFFERLDQSLALNTAQNFLTQFFTSLNLDKIPSHIINIYAPKTGADANSTSKDKANSYTFTFNHNIDKYPYYENANLLDTLNISISPNNTVAKFTYKSQPLPILSNPQKYNLIDKNKILQLLDSGIGEIAYIDILDVPFNSNEIPDVTINNYVLEYRFNEVQRKVIPYFRFFGTFSSPFTQAKANVTILLPAVEL